MALLPNQKDAVSNKKVKSKQNPELERCICKTGWQQKKSPKSNQDFNNFFLCARAEVIIISFFLLQQKISYIRSKYIILIWK
jgi:hypothetical protein